MNLLRGLLFDNIGLKFTALLLAVLVYLNVYTDRPMTMLLSFPLEYVELADSLVVSGPAPAMVQARLQGTGKQLIFMKVKEPRMKLSLAGAGRGRFERSLAASDLPLPADGSITVEDLVGPRVVSLEVDRRAWRDVPVAARVFGRPAAGYEWLGLANVEPTHLRVTGPEQVVLGLDSLRLAALRIDGKRDTLTVAVAPADLPEDCTTEPATVIVRLRFQRLGH